MSELDEVAKFLIPLIGRRDDVSHNYVDSPTPQSIITPRKEDIVTIEKKHNATAESITTGFLGHKAPGEGTQQWHSNRIFFAGDDRVHHETIRSAGDANRLANAIPGIDNWRFGRKAEGVTETVNAVANLSHAVSQIGSGVVENAATINGIAVQLHDRSKQLDKYNAIHRRQLEELRTIRTMSEDIHKMWESEGRKLQKCKTLVQECEKEVQMNKANLEAYKADVQRDIDERRQILNECKAGWQRCEKMVREHKKWQQEFDENNKKLEDKIKVLEEERKKRRERSIYPARTKHLVEEHRKK